MKKYLLIISLVIFFGALPISFLSAAVELENSECHEFFQINFNDYKSTNNKYFFTVESDGLCEYGMGQDAASAFNDCEKWRKENSIDGTCEPFAVEDQIVWKKPELYEELSSCKKFFLSKFEETKKWAKSNKLIDYYMAVVENNGLCVDGRGYNIEMASSECARRKAKFNIGGECEIFSVKDQIVQGKPELLQNYLLEASPTKLKEIEKVFSQIDINDELGNLFQIINLSSIKDDFFVDMTKYATSRMKKVDVNTIAIIYPVGKYIHGRNPEGNKTSFRGATFEVVLKKEEIKKIELSLKKFLKKTLCISPSEKKNVINNISDWIKIGGGSQAQTPVCKKYRIIMISIDEERRLNKKALQRIFFHEAYHAFQQDLTSDCRGPNDLWVIEAATEYFAQHSLLNYNEYSTDYVSNILKIALTQYLRGGPQLNDPGVAEKGLGAIRLMIEKGWLDEKRILDGSFFYKCDRVKKFKNKDPKIKFLKDNWFKIIEENGIYKFK